MARSLANALKIIGVGDDLIGDVEGKQDLNAISQAFGSGGTQQEQLQQLISQNPRAFLQNAPALKSFMELSAPGPTEFTGPELQGLFPSPTAQQTPAAQPVQPATVPSSVVADAAKNLASIDAELKALPARKKFLIKSGLSGAEATQQIAEERSTLDDNREFRLALLQRAKKIPQANISLEKKTGTKFIGREKGRLQKQMDRADFARKIKATKPNLSKSRIEVLDKLIAEGAQAAKDFSSLGREEFKLRNKVRAAFTSDGDPVFTNDFDIINGRGTIGGGELSPAPPGTKAVLDVSDPNNVRQLFATDAQIIKSQGKLKPVPSGTKIIDAPVPDEKGDFVRDKNGQIQFKKLQETFPGSGKFRPLLDSDGNEIQGPKSSSTGKLKVEVTGLQKGTKQKLEIDVVSGTARLAAISSLRKDFDPNFLRTAGKAVAFLQKFADSDIIPFVDVDVMTKMLQLSGFKAAIDPKTGKPDPEFFTRAAAFFSRSQQEFLSFRKFITGVAGGEKELEEIRQSFFDIKGDTPGTYLAKLDAIEKITADIINSRLEFLKKGVEGEELALRLREVAKRSLRKNAGSLKKDAKKSTDDLSSEFEEEEKRKSR